VRATPASRRISTSGVGGRKALVAQDDTLLSDRLERLDRKSKRHRTVVTAMRECQAHCRDACAAAA